MYLSKCKKCGLSFCDNCEQAAAELADGLLHSSDSVTMYQPSCPGCGSKEIAIGEGA
jgi:hypothetical protein